MTPELTALVLAALLQVIQFALMSIPANLEAGPERTLAPRSPDIKLEHMVSEGTRRLVYAFNNHIENLLLFAIACLVIHVSDQSSAWTSICAYTYLAARVVYIPAYYYGLVPWRTLIWATGFAATTLMLLAALV